MKIITMRVELPIGQGEPECNSCGHEITRHGIDAIDNKTPMCFDCLGVGQTMCLAMSKKRKKRRT